MSALKFKVFFPPSGELDCLIRERENVQGCADRAAADYARALREYDERIAALREQNVSTATRAVETPQIAILTRPDANFAEDAHGD